MTSRKDLDALEEIAKLRAHGRAQGWSIPQIVAAIVDQFGVSLLKAHRLARGWTRPQAVEAILATYDADGWPRPKLTCQRLCSWEHNPRIRPGEEYLDRLCRVYETRPDQLGYGHDYTPPAQPAATSPNDQPALPATGNAGDQSGAAYAGTSVTPLALTTGEGHDAGHHLQSTGEEPAATKRAELLHAIGVNGLAALLDRAGRAAVRLSSKLGSSNLGPVTIEQLQLRITGFLQRSEHTLSEERLRALLAQHEQVEALLDGRQPLDQRRQLYRIAGQLSALLGGTLFELGDYPNADAHLLTALQLAQQVGDHTLIASVHVTQSTVALWAGDFRAALNYAQDGQRYATRVQRAQLAARCEARAYARLKERSNAFGALQCANRAMPSQPVTDDPDAAWSLFSPAAWSCTQPSRCSGWAMPSKPSRTPGRRSPVTKPSRPCCNRPPTTRKPRSSWRPAWSTKTIPTKASDSPQARWRSTADTSSRTCNRPASSSQPCRSGTVSYRPPASSPNNSAPCAPPTPDSARTSGARGASVRAG
jgi:tetratricopeptide (TPR) repeat protein